MTGAASKGWFFGLLAVLWAGSIFTTSSGFVSSGELSHAVSTAAGGRISEAGFRKFWSVAWWIFVKGWHATEFGVLFLLARKAMPKLPWLAVAFACCYAISDEAHQLFVPYRGCRASDVCIDWLGITAAWAFWSEAVRSIRKRPGVLITLVLVWIGLVFLLSVYPFGLVTLNPGNVAGP